MQLENWIDSLRTRLSVHRQMLFRPSRIRKALRPNQTIATIDALEPKVLLATWLGTAGPDLKDMGSTNTSNDSLDGNGGNDTIYGQGGSDTVKGDPGNDIVSGGNGNDLVYGGSDDDYVYGNNHNDTIYGGPGNDRVHGGSGNDQAFGDDGNDTVTTGPGSDTIYGGNGDDWIYDYVGTDPGIRQDSTMVGGAGLDTFRFDNVPLAGQGMYVVTTDFKSGEDKVDLGQFALYSSSERASMYAFTTMRGILSTVQGGRESTRFAPNMDKSTGAMRAVIDLGTPIKRLSHTDFVPAPQFEPQDISLQVDGNEVIINPTIDFGKVPKDSTPPTRTFTVYNTGTVPLYVNRPTISSSDFEFAPNLSDNTPNDSTKFLELLFGESATFTVRMPTSVVGYKSATLTITSNDPDINENPINIKLVGEVLAPPSLEPTTVSFSSNAASDEGQSATFTVTLSNAVNRTVTVNYATSSGSALSGVDFTTKSGILTFNPYETVKTFPVDTIEDSIIEDNETYNVTLSNVSGGTLGTASAIGVIEDNDGTLIAVPFSGTGNVSRTIVDSPDAIAELSSITQPTPIFYEAVTQAGAFKFQVQNGSGTREVDWYLQGVQVPDAKVTKQGASWNTSYTVTLPKNNRIWTKASVLITKDGQRLVGGESSVAKHHLLHTFFAPDISVADRSGVTLKVRETPQAIYDAQYNLSDKSISGKLMLKNRGNQSAASGWTAEVFLKNSAGVIVKRLSFANQAALGVGERRELPFSFPAADQGAGNYTIGFSLDTTNVIAERDEWTPSEQVEAQQAIDPLIRANNATGNLGFRETSVVIPKEMPTVDLSGGSKAEGDVLSFVATLTNTSSQDVSITYHTEPISALNDDFVPRSGTITIPAGGTSAVIPIQTTEDTRVEVDETMRLVVDSVVGAKLGATAANGNIINDDAAELILSLTSPIDEGDSGASNAAVFTVRAVRPGTGELVEIDDSVSLFARTQPGTATEGVDYKGRSQTLFLGRDSNGIYIKETGFSIPIVGDKEVESHENLFVTVNNVVSSNIFVPIRGASQLESIIKNDDTVFVAPILPVAVEGSTLEIPVNLLAPSSKASSVDWVLLTDTGNVWVGPKTIQFPAGETSALITFTLPEDSIVNGTRLFTLRFSNPVNLELLPNPLEMPLTVLDNDAASVSIVGSPRFDEGHDGDSEQQFALMLVGDVAGEVKVVENTRDGNATGGEDYLGVVNRVVALPRGADGITRGGTYTIDANGNAIFPVSILGDKKFEDDESYTAVLSGVVVPETFNVTVETSESQGVIQNDDAWPIIVDFANPDGMFNTIFSSNGEGIYSVAGAGDFNGDGFDDVIVGLPGANQGTGAAYIILWTPDRNSSIDLLASDDHIVKLNGKDSGDLAGRAVNGVGDANGDGFDDVLISAFLADSIGNERPEAGECYLVFGGPSISTTIDLGDLGTHGVTFYGADSGDESGRAVGSGDINGDGYADVLIGARKGDGLDNQRRDAGDTYVVFGGASLPAYIDLAVLGERGITIGGAEGAPQPDFLGDQSGFSVGSADINGDGIDDVITGAYRGSGINNSRYSSGETYVIFGSSDPRQTIDLATLGSGGTIIGGAPGALSAVSVSGVGDVNGDGIEDLLIGATDSNGINNEKQDAGESYLVFGSTSLPEYIDAANLGSAGVRIVGADRGDQSGRSVSGGFDINGDGFDDILIGARYGDAAENSKPAAGDSYVVLGRPSFPGVMDLADSNAASVLFFGSTANGKSGLALGGLGDLNGDGFDDIIIGEPYASTSTRNGASYVYFGSDISKSVTHAGTEGPEQLSGDSTNNVMVSGRGADTVDGSGGIDVLRGGEGNDVFVIEDNSFRRVVGGTGFDRLIIGGSGVAYDLTTIANTRLADIEQIDITGTGNNSLTLNFQEVVSISSHSNTLLVRRDIGDTVNIGSGWIRGASRIIDSVAYEIFTQGAATLGVEHVQVEISGPRFAGEGETVVFSSSISGPDVARSWTATLDGVVVTTSSEESFSVTLPDDGLLVIDLTVQVGTHEMAAESFEVEVSNVAPEIQHLSGPTKVVRGQSANFSVVANDVTGDPLTASWSVTRRTDGVAVSSGTGLSFSTQQLALGQYSLQVVVDDGDGGTDSATTSFEVVEQFVDSSGVLYIGGTSANDTLNLQIFSNGQLRVRLTTTTSTTTWYDPATLTRIVSFMDAGNDTITASTNTYVSMTHFGGSGNDRLDSGGGNDIVYGGDGFDTIVSNAGDDSIYGEAGNDWIVTHAGNDFADGGLGDDKIEGSDGNDTLIGGGGNDTLLGGNHDDSIIGGDGDDSVDGSNGNDAIEGSAGNDTLRGGFGSDNIDGGSDNDSIDGQNDADTVRGGHGHDTVLGGDANDLVMGDAGNDSLDGGAGDDRVFGGDGDDTVNGGNGNDAVAGGSGADLLNGGTGNDRLRGDDGNDRLVDTSGLNTLHGGAGNDSLTGGTNVDVLGGGDGDDTLNGGTGAADRQDGGLGTDLIVRGLEENLDALFAGFLSDPIWQAM